MPARSQTRELESLCIRQRAIMNWPSGNRSFALTAPTSTPRSFLRSAQVISSTALRLTKIHKPTPAGRPIISGCDGPTERLSSFLDRLLQPIAQKQKLYLKDKTAFINLIETTKVPKNAILVSMDVTSLYTNVLQEEVVETVCKTYDSFYKDSPPIPTQYLKRALILQENSFEFNGKATSKHMELPWAPRWKSLLQISLWWW